MPSQEKPHCRRTRQHKVREGPSPHPLPLPPPTPWPPHRAPSPPSHSSGSARVSSSAPPWIGGGDRCRWDPQLPEGACRSSPVPPKPRSIPFTAKRRKLSRAITQARQTRCAGRPFPAPRLGARRHLPADPTRSY